MLKEALEGRLLKLRLFKHSRHCYSYDQFYYVFANRPPRLFRPSSYIFLFFFFLRNRGDANQENLWWHAVRKFWIGDLHFIIIFLSNSLCYCLIPIFSGWWPRLQLSPELSLFLPSTLTDII